MLKIRTFEDVEKFRGEVLPFLEKYGAENNLCLGILVNWTAKIECTYMAVVTKDNQIAAVLLQSIPDQIIVSKTENILDEDIPEFAKCLYESYPTIPGFVGESPVVLGLSKEISSLQGSLCTVKMNQRIYQLTEIKREIKGEGIIQKAELGDLQLVTEWGYQFGQDAGVPVTLETAAQKAKDLIELGRVFLWKVNDIPVSMCATVRPTNQGAVVSYVYTPKNLRGRGYASDAVTALCKKLLWDGHSYLCLYADLDNPISNKIYIEIGFEAVMDSVMIHFQKSV